MTLSLPEPCHHILPVALASLHIHLIEGDMQVNSPHLPFSLPEGLETSVEILTDSVGASIPESDPLDEIEGQGVVAECS
jgi:hypothetical protein